MKFANNIFHLVATQWIFFVSAVQLNRIHRWKTSVAQQMLAVEKEK